MRTITHDGKRYRFYDMTFYMDDDCREVIHRTLGASASCQAFWDEFASVFPSQAKHLTEIVGEVVEE